MMNKPKILIIEDNPVSRKVLKVNLETEEYNVTEAANATIALEEASKQKFDLIIQDLILPDMNGVTLYAKLRNLPEYDKIPIFAVSGFLSELDKQIKLTPFTVFLFKPVDPSYLLEVVKSHLPIIEQNKISLGKGKHALIADDNPIQLKLFSIQLKNAGFEVSTAEDGVVALKQARLKQPDVIISDILMPHMDGFGLCLEIKRDPLLSTIPVMLLTSHYLEDEDLALAKKVGAACYLTRTPKIEYLLSELMKILNSEPALPSCIPLELSKDIMEEHTIRTIRQLEQQVLDNTRLAQRCAMLVSQLSLISGMANALTTTSRDINESLKELLYLCLDATGISKGALFINQVNKGMILSQQVGYAIDQKTQIESILGEKTLIPKLIEKKQPLAIPSDDYPDQKATNFLNKANVKSAFVVPMFSGEECLGVLMLGSEMFNFTNDVTREFIRTLGMQFGQSIALASTFDKLGSSEKRYRQLVEISPDAIFIQQDDRFVYANSAALKLLAAKNSEDLLNHKFYNFFPLEYQANIKDYLKQDINFTPMSHSEGKIIDLKGKVLDIELVISPFLYKDKPALYMIMRDNTERKRSELHLEIQYAIAWIFAESATLFVATAKILKIICERLHWDCGTIWAVDKEANLLRCTRVWQMPDIKNEEFLEESQQLALEPGIGMLGQAWKQRKAIWKSDILKSEDFLRRTSAAVIGLNTALAFPIIFEDEVLGVIEFFSKKILPIDANLLLWFESIGNQFGLFLKRKHMEKQMLYLAEHDVLTGLSNRSLLEQYLNTALTTASEQNHKLAILFIDLDHFKYVNDSMGHQVGDLLLKEISERFRQCLRPKDTISRLGGDEFIIILPNVNRKEEVIDIIGRLQKQLAKHIVLKEKEISITASIGVSMYPDDGNMVQTLIKVADIAMYVAKEKGRNNFQFATHEMTEKAEGRGILLNNLRQAIENDEFILHYQPKIDVATKKISGMEALIRWQRPEGILLPESFISVIENSELINPMTEWVLKTAFLQNKLWQKLGLPTITMSINLSVRNLNKRLLQAMEKSMSDNNLDPNSFEIELTESILMENVENNIQILRNLKAMGFKISIDDFGTGYSSLSYLKRFPIDTIKIDQSFVRDIATDPDDATIVTAIIAMAHSLNFTVVAEGVETEAQLKFLCRHGCDEIQGFYFGRPMPVEEATQFIQNAKIDWHFDK